MIVVEASHAHVIKFLSPHCELSLFLSHCHFLGEKCDDENCIYFFLN
jgi:hypothetical protein